MTNPRILSSGNRNQPSVLFPTGLPQEFQVSLPRNELISAAESIGQYAQDNDYAQIYNKLKSLGLNEKSHEYALREMCFGGYWNPPVTRDHLEQISFQVLVLGLEGYYSERTASYPSLGLMVTVAGIIELISGSYYAALGCAQLCFAMDVARGALHQERLSNAEAKLKNLLTTSHPDKRDLEELSYEERSRLKSRVEELIHKIEKELFWMKLHFAGQKFIAINLFSSKDSVTNHLPTKEIFVKGVRTVVELKNLLAELGEPQSRSIR